MKKLLLIFLFPLALFGQGAYVPTKTVLGTVNGITRPVAGATITVCAASTGGIPCSPALANTVFQDSGLSVPLSNPLTTDSNGNYPQFAVAPGVYTITESSAGFAGYSYQLTIACAQAGACTIGTLTVASANVTGSLTAGSISTSGNLSVTGTATVTGATTLNSTVTVNAAENVNGVVTATSGGNAQQIVSATTTNSNQGYSAQNNTENMSFGIRAASSACAAESFMFRDITNATDLFCLSPTTGNAALTGTLNLNSTVSAAEAAAPSGAASRDILYADSTAHRLKMNNNNGGADVVVGAATSDTLTNKTFQGTGSGNAVTLLNSQDTLSPVTGNGTDLTLYTFTIPANTVQAGKGVRLTTTTTSNNAVAVTYKVVLGATTIFNQANNSGVENDRITIEIFNNSGVQNAQVTTGVIFGGGSITGNVVNTSAENFANALALKVTANEANPNTATPKKWILELIQ